ncbi:hypothetical protein [Thiolapillus sp.]
MIFKSCSKTAVLLLTMVLLGLSVGCSENDGKVAKNEKSVADVTQLSKEEIVKQRAQEHMDALIAMDWEKAYNFFSPATRSLKPFEVFANHMKGGAILRKSADVEKVECEEQLCKVTIHLHYIYMGSMAQMRGQEMDSRIHEKWLFSDGSWWVSPK